VYYRGVGGEQQTSFSCKDGFIESRSPTRGSLVKKFNIIGDTGGDDISYGSNCACATKIVSIELNPIIITVAHWVGQYLKSENGFKVLLKCNSWNLVWQSNKIQPALFIKCYSLNDTKTRTITALFHSAVHSRFSGKPIMGIVELQRTGGIQRLCRRGGFSGG
jgi:hypothetical protein